jgi:hypothetical protein
MARSTHRRFGSAQRRSLPRVEGLESRRLMAAIAGYVYLDPTSNGSNVNGGVDGQTVYLDLKGDGRLDAGDPTASTDTLGLYAFAGLAPGTYTVRVAPYPGNIATFPAGSGQTVTAIDGQVVSVGALGMLPTSSLLPLTYAPSPFGTHNPDIQTAEVNALYKLILNRAPDQTGGASAIAYLKSGGSVGQLADNLLTSAEYDYSVIASYYQTYLRRAGSAVEINAWVSQLELGETEVQVASAFLDSAEYSALFPANATFVQALFGDLLGRLSSDSEIAGGVNLLNDPDLTRSEYVSLFMLNTEPHERTIEGLYGLILARKCDVASLVAGANALEDGGETIAELAVGLFGSAEFIARANATVG